jgi:hypothetical protein
MVAFLGLANAGALLGTGIANAPAAIRAARVPAVLAASRSPRSTCRRAWKLCVKATPPVALVTPMMAEVEPRKSLRFTGMACAKSVPVGEREVEGRWGGVVRWVTRLVHVYCQ